MAVSVIVSNLNGAPFLPRLLESIKAQEGVTMEIIVVDRESKDASHEILRRHSDVKVVSEPALSGLVSGYHRGVREASHEHLFFCNEDMWFDPACLASLERHISLAERVGAADPWQWSYDEKNWIHGGLRFRRARWAINGVHPFWALEFTVNLTEGEEVPWPCAGAFLMHRQVYEALGGWDTSFFLDNEEPDLFIRAWQHGWKCVTVPSAKVYHAVGMSNPQQSGKPGGVGKRRYVSNRAGKTIIPWKYFSACGLWIGAANFLVMFANNILKLRLKNIGWDLSTARNLLGRVRSIREFRSRNGDLGRRMPGERFFAIKKFQLRDE